MLYDYLVGIGEAIARSISCRLCVISIKTDYIDRLLEMLLGWYCRVYQISPLSINMGAFNKKMKKKKINQTINQSSNQA